MPRKADLANGRNQSAAEVQPSLRLPQNEDVVLSRSRCRACDRTLSWPDLVPVARYVWTKARCSTCGDRIPLRYPLVELAAAAVGVWAALASPSSAEAILTALLGWQLLLIALIDFDHHWLPDRLTLPLLATGLLRAVMLDRRSAPGSALPAYRPSSWSRPSRASPLSWRAACSETGRRPTTVRRSGCSSR